MALLTKKAVVERIAAYIDQTGPEKLCKEHSVGLTYIDLIKRGQRMPGWALKAVGVQRTVVKTTTFNEVE